MINRFLLKLSKEFNPHYASHFYYSLELLQNRRLLGRLRNNLILTIGCTTKIPIRY